MPAPTMNKQTSQTKTNLEHLKHHVKYPTDRKGLIATCSNMMDVPEADRTWFNNTLPEQTYKSADDVMKALLNKV